MTFFLKFEKIRLFVILITLGLLTSSNIIGKPGSEIQSTHDGGCIVTITQ